MKDIKEKFLSKLESDFPGHTFELRDPLYDQTEWTSHSLFFIDGKRVRPVLKITDEVSFKPTLDENDFYLSFRNAVFDYLSCP